MLYLDKNGQSGAHKICQILEKLDLAAIVASNFHTLHTTPLERLFHSLKTYLYRREVCINDINFTEIKQDSPPCRMQKFENLLIFGEPEIHKYEPINVKFGTREGPVHCAKFHINPLIDSLRQGEKHQNRYLSKFNTGDAAAFNKLK